MDGALFWFLAVTAAVLVGAGKGGIPIVGMLGVPVLSLVISPVVAAGLLLPVYVVSDMFGLYAYRHEFNRRVVLIVAAGMTIGILIGYLTARLVPEPAVTLLVGLVGFAFALSLLLRKAVQQDPKPARIAPGIFWGTITGFTSFVSHSGAPPYQIYTQPLGLSKAVFAGTATVAFAYCNAVKLIPYYLLGQLSLQNLKAALVLAPFAAIAVFLGVRVVRKLPEALFFKLVTWALLLISIKLIWDGASRWMAL